MITEIKEYKGLKFKVRTNDWDHNIVVTEINRNPYQISDGAKVIIDIGAHIGGTAIKYASMGATVYAYEPDKDNFQLLVENVKLNNLEDKVHCFNIAVGTNNKIYINSGNAGGNGAYQETPNLEIVKTTTLKEVFENNKIEVCDVLKMDCEGGEYDILPPYIELLNKKIKQISVELHFATERHESEELQKKFGMNYVEDFKNMLGKFYKLHQFNSDADSAIFVIAK